MTVSGSAWTKTGSGQKPRGGSWLNVGITTRCVEMNVDGSSVCGEAARWLDIGLEDAMTREGEFPDLHAEFRREAVEESKF